MDLSVQGDLGKWQVGWPRAENAFVVLCDAHRTKSGAGMSNEPTTTALPPATPERDIRDASAPHALVSPDRHRSIGNGRAVALSILAIVSIGGWYVLYRWYGLFENRNNTHFGFEKIPGGFDSPIIKQTALIFLVLAAAYAAAIWILRSIETMTPLVTTIVVVMIAGPAIANVALYPVGALDVFNYLIELKLAFHYDRNPYLVTFEAYRADPFALPAFLVNITLFYGPAWLLISWIPTAVVGFSDVIDTLLALKIFNLALLALTALLIARYQRDSRHRWVAVAIFLANPLVLFEGVANTHNDVLLTTFLIGAMLALQRRSFLAGPLLVLSALVKLYTVALAPLFVIVALKERWGWKRAGSTTLLSALTLVIVCAPYWENGKLVDGLQIGLEQSQVMDHVSLFSLAQQYAQEREAEGRQDADFIRSRPSFEILPEGTKTSLRYGFTAAFILAVLLIAASVWKGRSPELAAAETMLLLLLFLTNLYGWYLIPVFALFALRPDRLSRGYIAVATALGMVYYPMFVYAHFNTAWSRFQVHLFLALFLTVPIVVYLVARAVNLRGMLASGSAGNHLGPPLPR